MATRSKTSAGRSAHAVALENALAESTVPAVSRAVAILRLLGTSPEPLGVQSIARELSIVPSTCLHILRTLAAEEFVSCDPVSKLYTLNAGVLLLARQWLSRDRFTPVAQPALDRLARQYPVSAIGVQVVGLEHMIVVAMARSDTMVQLNAQIGSRFPATVSASGRCLAAFGGYARDELRQSFKRLRWDHPPKLGEWERQVAETRQRGYATDEGNYMAGITVVSAPVFDGSNRLSHCLVAVGLGGQLQEPMLGRIGQDLRESAAQVSARLGAIPSG